ncbi:hypothetical protein [Nocardia sp. NPDC004260]
MTGDRRFDAGLRTLDVASAVAAAMSDSTDDQDIALAAAAVAAAAQFEDVGVGPNPVAFLAGCVRVMGLPDARRLPAPLVGAQPTAMVRAWMTAACPDAEPDVARDEAFARWLEMVAAVLRSRRTVVRGPRPPWSLS